MTLNEAAAIPKRTKPRRCPKCGVAFKHAGSMQKHLNRHRDAAK